MLHSEINHFADFLRSVVEARSAYLPFLDWKVCTIAIVYKFIHCVAHMLYELI